jgi:hypothetical protein
LPVAVLVYHKIERRDNEEQGRKDGSVITQVEQAFFLPSAFLFAARPERDSMRPTVQF